MRISDTLSSLTRYFTQHGIEHARTDAEWLLATVLGCKRLELFLDIHRALSAEQVAQLRSWSIRRAKREPLQYIIGSVEFFGKTLQVDPRVLIPRPETEELVYQLQQRFQGKRPPATGLDLGTGSGAIAIALASLFPQLQIVAVDHSMAALEVAQRNAEKHFFHQRIQFLCSDWFEKVTGLFDVIVANPPYLGDDEIEEAQPEVRCFEPREALWSAENGLSAGKKILSEAPRYLNPGGVLVMETGCRQMAALRRMATGCGYTKTQSTLDLSGRERYIWEWVA
ncbi:MAG: peptide chain release factor N(5)-glutamine methyltransferase [Opitutales bacterium]|nr:peptide chain release factor N(5)-glutamine methyltransferase [Opitutales bacterium]